MPIDMICAHDARGAYQGMTLTFTANVPRPVRDSLIPLARSLGAVPVDSQEESRVAAATTGDDVDEALAEQIRAAMRDILDGNARNDLSVEGIPKVRAIEKRIGQNITTTIRDQVWKTLTHG